MAQLSATITQGCQNGGGVLTLSQASPAPGAGPNLVYTWQVLDGGGNDYGTGFTPDVLPVYASGLANGTYTSRVSAVDQDSGDTYVSRLFTFTINCASGGGGTSFQLDSYSHTDETVALNDGTATVQASGGVAPLTASLVELGMSQPATSGQPNTFRGLPPATYTLRVTDSSSPTPQTVQAQVTVLPYQEPSEGCQDEYAVNYDPAATSGGTASCTYAVTWRSAWGPTGMAVRVAAVAGQVESFVDASLRVGFRPGHPLASTRPLGAPIRVRATVGPDGYATFRLSPFLQPLLGAKDGLGGYRLDLNSPGAHTTDLLVGYELRRAEDNTLLEHGYALNSAVPDEWLTGNRLVLSPFARQPLWPGYEGLVTSLLVESGAAPLVFGGVGALGAEDVAHVALPCPPNPLPVAWLNPWGGISYWVFQGKTQIGLTIEEGQQYQEAATGERRYSERGVSRRTYQARSGVFKGTDLAEGLATLDTAIQVWLRPVADAPWVPVSISSGDFPVRRVGVLRNEVSVTFVEGAAQYAQGQ